MPSPKPVPEDLHQLAGAHGWRPEHVRARAELGLLKDVAAEQVNAQRGRSEWVDLLRQQKLLPADDMASGQPHEPDEAAVILAMHRFLADTPSRLKLISPHDIVGESRQPNLPGTVDEHPNWRLPLPQTLEQLRDDPRVAQTTAVFRDRR